MSKFLSLKKEYVSYVAVLALGLLLSALAASAATTISTNIATGGNITTAAGYGLDAVAAGVLNIGTTTATSIVIGSSTGLVGIASTTPWGQFSINANATAVNVPQFVIGSSTGTNLIVLGSGNVGIGSTTPYVKLGVVGTTTSSLGVVIGGTGTPINKALFGTCALIAPPGAGATVAASSTVAFDCAVGAATPGDIVMAQFSTSSPGMKTGVGLAGGPFAVVSAAASSTAGYIVLQVENKSGAATQVSLAGYGSTTAYWILR